jgi:hypothetical protein
MRRSLLDEAERWTPATLGVVACGWSWAVTPLGFGRYIDANFDVVPAVTIVFTVIAFATPLAVGLFAITLAPGGGFIQKLYGTKTFAIFVSYVIRALALGITSVVISLPFLVAKSSSVVFTTSELFLPVWWGVAVWALAAIARVLLIFMIWANSYSQPLRDGEGPHERKSRPEPPNMKMAA